MNDKQAEILEEAKERFNAAEAFWSEPYTAGYEDYLFRFGLNQWSDEYVAERKADGRPCLTLNLLDPYANQVINDIRQSRPAIRVSPVDDKADVDTADIYSGIIRNIERQSKANIAYDTAAMNSVSAGIGWIRIRTDYCDPMSFDQEIIIDRVLDFRSAYIDPNSNKLDGSDAEYAFIFADIPEEQFEEQYKDAQKEDFQSKEWNTEESVRIVEYFYKDYKSIKIFQTDNGIITAEEKALLEEAGIPFQVIDERDTQIPIIKWCKLTQSQVLEEGEWLGEYIPLIPVFGVEQFIGGRRTFSSLIRQGKDAQKMYNYWNSLDTEIVALQPKAPWVGPVGSFESTPNKWAMANNKNYAFLEYDIVYDDNQQRAEPPSRQPPIQGSAHIMQKAISARDDIRLALGMPEANMGQRSNEISGVAVKNRQIEGDNATFHFMDNLACSMTHVGVVIVDLIRKIYSRRKIARILGDDGEAETVPINQPFVKTEKGLQPAKDGRYDGIYDMKAGKYDVVVDVGPSYSSKRQQAADTLIQVTQAKPELFDVVGDLMFRSMDIPFSAEIADRIKASMPPELLGDDPQAAKLQQAASAIKQLEDQLLTLSAALDEKKKDQNFENSLKVKELELESEKVRISAAETAAKIEKMRAETQNINEQALLPVTQAILEIAGQVQDVGQALDIILSADEGEATSAPQALAIQTEQNP